MTVFRILASRTELYLIEAYVKATNPQEAEILFYNAYENEESAISWTQDFDSSELELHSIETVPSDHDPVPSSDDRSLCLLCGRVVTWTGSQHRHHLQAPSSQGHGFTWNGPSLPRA